MSTRSRGRERGMTIAMLALFIVVLFAMAALAIDLGVAYTARTSAQHAADAAALAGAYTFVADATAPQPTAAQNAAVATAAQNKILGTAVTISTSDVSVNIPAKRVTVTVSRLGGNGIATFFAKVLNINSLDVQTQATAEAALSAGGDICIKPIYIPNTALSSLSPSAACTAGQVMFDSNGQLTSWAQGQLGNIFLVRPLGGGTAIVPSQWGSLDFGSGAATYRCAIDGCLNTCGINPDSVACGKPFLVETGNMDGPTNQGFNDLIGNPPDQWQGIGEYLVNGTVQDTSKSLASLVVWDNCHQTISPGTAGQEISIAGFATAFITSVNGSGVWGRLVYIAQCATTGGAGGGGITGTGPSGVPIRLVQNQ